MPAIGFGEMDAEKKSNPDVTLVCNERLPEVRFVIVGSPSMGAGGLGSEPATARKLAELWSMLNGAAALLAAGLSATKAMTINSE